MRPKVEKPVSTFKAHFLPQQSSPEIKNDRFSSACYSPNPVSVFFFFFLILVDLANSIPQTIKEPVRAMDVDGGS